ncbi:MAG: TonB-dependent receptor [Bacteroidetes bacterium]|nr:MAG: TonB-dependent receptor [Bacteroidota bacterium]REK07633.1 MAG: TonB-dependent receptor [Bacteroidota bacterium]REK37040.1 MAG: TonB-dependent receptor [Bacteroidota bacterium]REK47861.1 MAG: TonB-dependent receptor [Bacteroidota bacterium]
MIEYIKHQSVVKFRFIKSSLGFFFCMFHTLLMAQGDVQISGKVIDSLSADPIPYATVALFQSGSTRLLNGTTTDEKGRFILQSEISSVYLEISFIGFEKKTLLDLPVREGNIDLGEITLKADQVNLSEVQVTGERSSMEFKLDKRVFNVGKDISSSGMSALEVLNRVPSVNVDIEGRISLRGNTGVQILINGKPSVLADESSNALGTLTSDMIESIEVITNPSAKYEAGGTSGIINIILKKEEKKGFNGSVSVNTGIPDNHSVGVSMNRRTENFNFFTQFGLGYRSLPTENESLSRNLLDGSSIESEGLEYRNEKFYNITLGTDYHINDWNVLTLSGSFAFEDEEQPSETKIRVFNGNTQPETAYTRTEQTTASNPKYQYDLQYKKQFENHEDHVFLFSALGSFFGKEQSSEFINQSTASGSVPSNQETGTSFFERDFSYKLDYTNPLSRIFKIEAGAMYDSRDVGNDYEVFDLLPGGIREIDSSLSNNFDYVQRVLGIYGTGSYEGEKWGLKFGLRMENTDLSTLLENTGQENKQQYTDLFPTIHSSYKFSKRFSAQAGYSKRIFRPRLWDLNPFFNIRNNFNIRRGNPELESEYADSYELTGVFILEKASLNASVYHLYTSNVIERITLYENNVSIVTPENIGKRNQTGIELNGKYNFSNKVSINGDFNYGWFSRDGRFEGQDFSFNGEKWTMRMTGRFKLPGDLEAEMSGEYQSGFETIQGETSAFAFADFGLRKKIMKGKIVINFAVSDVFSSRIRENTVQHPEYNLYDFSKRGRFTTLGLSYSFGKGEAMSYTGRRR